MLALTGCATTPAAQPSGQHVPVSATAPTVVPSTVPSAAVPAPTSTTRAATTGTPTRPSTSRPAQPAPAPAYATNLNQDQSTTRWDPCRPITYRVNATAAPAGAASDIRTALKKVSAATGLRFTYAGTTTTVPTRDTLTGPGTADLTIAWVAPGTSDLLDNATETARGGWQTAPTLDPATGLISWRIVRGYVLLDTTDAPNWNTGFGTGRRQGTLLMHELGHAVGLNHVLVPGQIMNGQITASSTSSWGQGDLHGLRQVGNNHGCLP